jgi:hypothetical protein
MPLASNDIKKSHDKLFCSAHNNLIFVVVSMLFVGHEPVRGTSHCRTLPVAPPHRSSNFALALAIPFLH